MNFKEWIAFIFENSDKSFHKIFNKLEDYSDVKSIEDLMDLISFMDKNNYFKDYYEVARHINNQNIKYKKDLVHLSNNAFLKTACSMLDYPGLFHRSKTFVNLESVEAVLFIILFNLYYFSHYQDKSLPNTIDLVCNNDIIRHLAFQLEDFKMECCVCKDFETFIKKISKINFDNEKTKYLHKEIFRLYLSLLMIEDDVDTLFAGNISVAAEFLMACNALKHNRESITCEDVVAGYKTALNLMREDLNEYVLKYYDVDTDLTLISESDLNSNNEGFGFKGAVSFIFAILMFLEVILIIIYIKNIINPEIHFTDDAILRFTTLIVSFYIAGRFYKYLSQGSDINFFEECKSKVMLVFIIIFIITVYIGTTF